MIYLSEIEGLDAAYEEILKDAGINIAEKPIHNWGNRADLPRIKDVSTQYADLLEYARVNTVH